MTDTGPSVALLFDDTGLVAQLRDALHACGSRIVHEGTVAGLDRDLLRELDADVLVINLDDAAADALDSLYALVDGDRPRIIFNDAEASAALTGWDRARWARHLAVKIYQMGEIDPPRPTDARAVEVSAVEPHGAEAPPVEPANADSVEIPPVEPAVADGVEVPVVESEDVDSMGIPVVEPGDADSVEVPAVEPADVPSVSQDEIQPVGVDAEAGAADAHDADGNAEEAQRSLIETQALSAELEALLASAEMLDGDADGATADAGLLAPDGSELTAAEFAADEVRPDAGVDVDPPVAAPAAPAMGLDDLLDMLPMGDEPAVYVAPVSGGAAAPELPAVPAEWALVDDDEIVGPATFGVEKQSAADFLAPEAELMADDDEPVLNLELVSMEQAIAPGPPRADVEMHLDELHMALSRLVLTGATLGGTGAALAFYAALPATTQLTFLHTQHLRGQSVADLVAQLAGNCRLTVTLAADGASTRPGEILVVPPGCRVRVRRDAGVDVQTWEDELQEPSIDESFRMAADTFGRDALAIVFSGHSTDSIAGSKAIHAAGGRVWVETAAPEYADMVHEISDAGVVDYSGTPEEMAAYVAEKFA